MLRPPHSAASLRAPVMIAVVLALLVGLATSAAAHDSVDGASRTAGARPRAAAGPMRGLELRDTGQCAGGYRIVGTPFCTHGPDARPAGRRPAVQPRSLAATIEGPLPDAVICDGDGTSGERVQAIYARASSMPSRLSTVLPQIRTAAAGVQSTFLASAARTDGLRRPRWVTDGSCNLRVVEAVLTPAAAGNFNATIEELRALGHDRADRKYLIWFDARAYCGIATFWGDDKPTPDNLSNSYTGYARVDTACWGWAEAHELMHTLGAVQNSAPHSTYGVAPGAFAHCTDDWDVMCYPDAPGVTMTIVCPDRGLDGQFDCGNDDYFHTDPAPTSYLGSHWNTADSDWLERTIVDLVPPRLRLVDGAQVTGSSIPATASFASTAPLAGLEQVGLQRRRDDAAWVELTPGAGAASMPLVLAPGHAEQLRARAIDAAGLPGPWTTGPRRAVRLMSDGSRALQWAPSWVAVEDANALGGTLRRASKPGATVTLRTAATDLGIVGTTGPDHGRLEVWVDGARQRTVDLYAATASGRRIVDVVTMAPGQTHTVRLRVGAGRNASSTGGRVEIDALVLLTP